VAAKQQQLGMHGAGHSALLKPPDPQRVDTVLPAADAEPWPQANGRKKQQQ
jgi:hypothetical protein